MRKVVIVVVVLTILLTLCFGIFWKEGDHMWWDVYWDWISIGGELWDWIDMDFTIPIIDYRVVWKVSLYNSWCLFRMLKILCFASIIMLVTIAFLWYYTEPIYKYKSETHAWVSHDKGKNWEVEDFELMKTNCIHWSNQFRKCALGKKCTDCRTYTTLQEAEKEVIK